jgi:predicted TIM-barrel fold metal-dependent hydrolase
MPRLIEWAVREAGVEKILFGTDTPLYHCAMQRARIECAELADAQKRRILHDNAFELLKLQSRLSARVERSNRA